MTEPLSFFQLLHNIQYNTYVFSAFFLSVYNNSDLLIQSDHRVNLGVVFIYSEPLHYLKVFSTHKTRRDSFSFSVQKPKLKTFSSYLYV